MHLFKKHLKCKETIRPLVVPSLHLGHYSPGPALDSAAKVFDFIQKKSWILSKKSLDFIQKVLDFLP